MIKKLKLESIADQIRTDKYNHRMNDKEVDTHNGGQCGTKQPAQGFWGGQINVSPYKRPNFFTKCPGYALFADKQSGAS